MNIAVVFGLNQVVSHGFGLFLFAAIVPLMRESIGLDYWHIAAAGAITQLSYLFGAFLLGTIGASIDMRKVMIGSGILTSSLLFSIPYINNPILVLIVLAVMATSAASSWGAIVELIGRYAPVNRRSTYLSSASSGTAWGYSIIGLLLIVLVPQWGWEMGWRFASLFGFAVLCLTLFLFHGMKKTEEQGVDKAQALKFIPFLKTTLLTKTALLACLMFFLIGMTTMPFSTWLNSYIEELKLPLNLAGISWTTVGVTGMVAGVLLGSFADTRGNTLAITVVFLGFALSMLALSVAAASMLIFACIGYGFMYFPIWGVVAGWLNETFDATSTMRISGFCMITFGMGGATGNLLLGAIREATGSLYLGFLMIAVLSVLLALIGLYVFISYRTKQGQVVPSRV